MAAPTVTVNVMLAIHEKKTLSIDLYKPLRQYIVIHYSEREAQDMEEDFQAVKQMRNEVEKASDSLEARRDLMQSYYRALCVMESRFPISSEKEHVHTISFTWHDAFKQGKKATQQNIHFEKAAIIFNLAAIQSQIALSADRTSANGLKQACNCFQAAAGAFAFLRDNISMKASVGQSTLDVSVECAGMLERLMLAQAQECFFEKVISDGKPNSLCAKVARQVSLYYEEAYAALNLPPLNQHFDRTWIAHVQLKAAQFYAEACYRLSLELHEKEEIAEEIAWLKDGITKLLDCKKSAKGVVGPLLDAVSKLEGNINRNLERAMKENDRVYLMRVPQANSLPPLPTASLVKSMPMHEFLDASKEKMFAQLVPDSSAKALSRYTEMVDEIIRAQAEKLQQESEITRVKLKEMDLPDSLLALEGNATIPDQLKEDVEAVQVGGGPAGLEAEMQQLRDLRRVNQELLVQTEELLEKESREDAQFRTQFGTRWTRPQSSTLTKNLQDRLNRFAGNLKQATESDARIERAIRDNYALMAILDCRPIEAALPNLSRPIMSLDGNEDAIVGALKQSLRQLEMLGSQRAGLEDMLKEMKRKDDILPKLMATSGSYEDLFKKELAKYDRICQEVAQNVEAQEQFLQQIQAQNDAFSAVFNLEDYRASREKGYKQINAAVAKYQEIRDNINEGLKFYVTLQDAITNLKQQCSDFAMTRNIQCREMMEDLQRQLAGLNFNDNKTGYNYPPVGQSTQRMAPSVSAHSDQHNAQQTGGPRPPYYSTTAQSMPAYSASPAPTQPHNVYQAGPQNPHPPPPYYAQAPNSYHPSPGMPPQPSVSHDYSQPAYPGWRGSYYNAPPGSHPPPSVARPPPPYHMPPPPEYYSQQQHGFYKH
eukprot:Gb_12639 [translate_table: standard]